MRKLIIRAALIPILFSLVGFHARNRRRTSSPLNSSGQASSQADTSQRIADARVTDSSTTTTPTPTPTTTTTTTPQRNYTPTYTRDSQGRVTRMTVTLKKGEYTPQGTDTLTMADKRFDDIPPGKTTNDGRHRGHVLGAQLGGTNHTDLQQADLATLRAGGTLPPDRWKDYENFVAMEGKVNTPLMVSIENIVANGVQNHDREVQYTVEFDYSGTSEVPTNVHITADTIDNKQPPVNIDENIPNVQDPRDPPHNYTRLKKSDITWS
jgi:hypothetical protein